jgi:hypothetical protein
MSRPRCARGLVLRVRIVCGAWCLLPAHSAGACACEQAHRAFEVAEARAAAAKEAKAKMERESAAKRAAMPSLPAGGKLAPLGGLAPMSESQRTAAAEKTMALINKPPAAAPAAVCASRSTNRSVCSATCAAL